MLHKEGNGGDNVAVRWQLPGGVWENPADPNLPIPGVRLSPYVDDTLAPTADIMDVVPDPRETPVGQINIVWPSGSAGWTWAT